MLTFLESFTSQHIHCTFSIYFILPSHPHFTFQGSKMAPVNAVFLMNSRRLNSSNIHLSIDSPLLMFKDENQYKKQKPPMGERNPMKALKECFDKYLLHWRCLLLRGLYQCLWLYFMLEI